MCVWGVEIFGGLKVVPFGHDESLGVFHVLCRFVVKTVGAPEELQLTTRCITNVKWITPAQALVRLAVSIDVRRR